MTKSAQLIIDGYELKHIVDTMPIDAYQKVAVFDAAVTYVPLNFLYELGINSSGSGYEKLKFQTERVTNVTLGDDVFNMLEAALQEEDEGEKETDYDLVCDLTKQTINVIVMLTQQLLVTFTRLFPNPTTLTEIVDFTFSEEKGTDLVYDLTYTTAT